MSTPPILLNYFRNGNTFDLKSCLKVFSIFLVIYCLVNYLWRRRRLYYWASKMEGPFAWPIIGNALYFSGGTDNILKNVMLLCASYKSPVRAWLGQRLFYGLTQPEQFEIALNNVLEKEDLYKFAKCVVGDGLFTAPVKIWRPHKKLILPTFSPKILNSFVEIFAEQSTILVEQLEEYVGEGYVDIYEKLNRCTIDTIFETSTGTKTDSQTKHYCDMAVWLERAMELCFARMFKIWLHPDILWKLSSYHAEMTDLAQKLRGLVREILIKKKEEYHQRKRVQEESFEESPKRKVFLDYLIELSEGNSKWTDEDILDEALTLVIAGSDSTANIDGFALLLLGMHQDIQEKVHEELHSIFGDSTRKVTPQDLPRMTYLERVIKETLRLFPIAPVIVRYVDEDLQMGNITLPKGGACVLSIISAHRDPQHWPDPMKFDPDRFLPEETTKRHPYSYIPFSAGPRSCIGPRYAMMAMKSVLSTVLRNYRVYTNCRAVEDIRLKVDLMLKSVDGYKLKLENRNNRD